MYDPYGGSFPRFLAALVPFGMALAGSLLANFPISFTSGFLPAPLFGLMPVYFFGFMTPAGGVRRSVSCSSPRNSPRSRSALIGPPIILSKSKCACA